MSEPNKKEQEKFLKTLKSPNYPKLFINPGKTLICRIVNGKLEVRDE